MSGRFDYVRYDDQATRTQEAFKEKVQDLEVLIDNNINCGRSRALAHTKLEEFYMWIGKGVRNDQITRNGSAAHVPERG